MKIKRFLAAALAVVTATAALCFASCGKKDKIDPNDPYSGVEITVGIANNSNEKAILNTFRTAYLKKYPTRKISIDAFTGEFDNVLATRVSSNRVPDVVQVYDFSAEYWTSKGVFAPLDDLMTAAGISDGDFFDQIVTMMKSGTDGKKYWAARDYNKVVVAINKQIFEIAEVALPTDDWTWEDFVATCNALKAKSSAIRAKTGQAVFYPVDAQLNWESVYYPAIKSYGGDLFDTENNTALKNPDGIKNGLNKLLSLADNNLAVSPSETATGAFAGRQAAMCFTVRPNITSLANSLKAAKAEIDFVSLPAFTDNGENTSYIGVGCTGYALSATSKGKEAEAAWEFIKFIISEEGQDAFSKAGTGIPVLKSLALDKNASFRTYLPNANHDAFIKFQERDLPMNYLHGVNANKHLNLRTQLKNELLKNLYNASDRNAYYTTLKTKLESVMR